MKAEGTRNTLVKRIAAAPTFAQKWKTALLGGPPETAIESLAFGAASLRQPSLHGPEWQAGAVERLKVNFTETLFAALMKDDAQPFEELIEAMASCRRYRGNITDYILAKNKVSRGRNATSRRLRLALLILAPEDRQSLPVVCKALDRMNVDYPDQSHVWHVMQEISVGLLLPGQRCQWFINEKLVRELRVAKNGKLTNLGMSREDLESKGGHYYRELIPPVVK